MVGGVGADGSLVGEGYCADVEGGGGLVYVWMGTVWACILGCVWAFCEGGGGGADD